MKYNWRGLQIGQTMTLPIRRRTASASAKKWGQKLKRKFQVSVEDGKVVVMRLPGGYARNKYPWETLELNDDFEMYCNLSTGRSLASRMGMKLDKHFSVIEDFDGTVLCRRLR